MLTRGHYYKMGKKSLGVVILINLVLFFGKFLAGIYSRSQALIADSVHTASDALTTLVVLAGFKYASTPADEHHPYGHGRAESVAAKLVSLVLIFIGLKIAYDSLMMVILQDFDRPHQIALWMVIFSIFIKEAQFRYALKYARKIKSTSLLADAWHHRSDAMSSVVALAGISAARLGYEILDPIAGFVVGVIVIRIGVRIFRLAFDELLDGSLPVHTMKRIEKLAYITEGVRRVTDLKTRKLGIDIFVDMKIEVDKEMTVEESHLITAKVRRDILKNMPNTRDVLIHVEPFEGPSDKTEQ